MQRTVLKTLLGLVVALAAAVSARAVVAQPADLPNREQLMQAVRDGNYAEAYQGLSRLAREPATPGNLVAEDLPAAIQCLQQLNRVDEIDAFRTQVVAAHPDDWRVLAAIAKSYMDVDHYGYMIAGEFVRGPLRGGQGRVVHATARDRVRALQLYYRAMQLAEHDDEKTEPCNMLRQFADAIVGDRYSNTAWRLQSLTDLTVLPDYEEGWGYDNDGPRGAPVDAEGNPIYYDVPLDWDSTANDGQRWRWVLERMVAWQPQRRAEELSLRAYFLQSQFGVETIAEFGAYLPQSTGNDEQENGVWTLHTLGEDETIARLATGVKRFKLPDDHNFIKLFQRVIALSPADPDSGLGLHAIGQLGNIFENRRQYPRAAEYWQQAIARTNGDQQQNYQQQLDQIVGNWGQFESVATQPAGRGASVEFRFRNATHVQFVAQQIDVRLLLADVKAYLKSNPDKLDWRQLDISNVGYRLVHEYEQKYVGAEAARWNLDLEPRENHFDKRITVATPLQKAGAYLLTAELSDGNTSKIVLWLADTAILRKPMPDKSYYFVANAVTGQPIPKANVEFFGYRQQHLDGNKFQIETKNLAAYTDEHGQAYLPSNDENAPFQWLVTATTDGGRLAYLGFESVWPVKYLDEQYNQTKAFVITDRPVYRPGQAVQFKVWIRQAQYDLESQSRFAHQSFQIEIHNPMDEKVYSETLTTDTYGGLAGTLELPVDATLGEYQLSVVNHGSGTFRVEEYKKPEFEVTVDAPTEPVMLGDTITATIHAKYYFGSPVTDARVKYKVLRTPHTERWFPPGPWDWLYGPGYWWFGQNYDWYPGWRQWGCLRPVPPWFWYSPGPPELVSDGRSPDQPRRHARSVDRHLVGQGATPRPGPELPDSSRGGRHVAADDRRHRPGAGGPRAVQSVRLGRPRLLPRGRHCAGQLRRPASRRQAGRRQGQAPPAEDRLRPARRRSGRNRSPHVGLAHLGPGPRRAADQGVGKGPLSARLRGDRRGWPHDRRRLHLYDHRRRLQRQRLPLQRSRDRARQARVRARREGAIADQHQPRRLDGVVLRPALQRRLPAAAGFAAQGQEHDRPIGRDAQRHAQLLRRSGDRLRRSGAHRGQRDSRSAGQARPER